MSNRFAVSATGRLATDPTLYTSAATQRASFRLAVEDRHQAADGQWETRQTIFHDVTAWGRLAEITLQQLRRGDAVVVAGTLKFDTYEHEGAHRTHTEIVADAIGPDLRLASVTIARRDSVPAAGRDSVTVDRRNGGAAKSETPAPPLTNRQPQQADPSVSTGVAR